MSEETFGGGEERDEPYGSSDSQSGGASEDYSGGGESGGGESGGGMGGGESA